MYIYHKFGNNFKKFNKAKGQLSFGHSGSTFVHLWESTVHLTRRPDDIRNFFSKRTRTIFTLKGDILYSIISSSLAQVW
jgi:hypothetical protein